jgi:hypothetical protein
VFHINALPGFFELREELLDVFDEVGDEVDVPGVLFEVVRDEVQFHVP